MERIYSRRASFATAAPSSACVLDYGSSFIYRQHVLCYMSYGVIRVRSILGRPNEMTEIDTGPMASRLSETYFGATGVEPEISLLHYSDGVVSLHFDYSETDVCSQWRDDEHWIIYIELRKFNPVSRAGVHIISLPAGASKLFVRNTATYFYYGAHTGLGAHGHHEWKVHGHSLSSDNPLPPNTCALQLDDFVGSDLGSTVAFEIHDGYFYAVSNQTSFVVEEVDWTSFYHCIRFPLARPVKEAVQVNTRVYRRQHAEGPINDSWTDLGLQIDEKTNRLQIVEARREWLNGGSKQERTFYTREVTFPPWSAQGRQADAATVAGGDQHMQSASPSALPTESSDATLEDDGSGGPSSSQAPIPLLPEDDLLVQTLSSGNNPHWAPAEERLPRSYHPERRHEDGVLAPIQAFILARTKLRAYNLSCSAFVDLVEDDRCCPTVSNAGGPPCLRLRIGARRKQPFLPLVPECCLEDGEKGKGRAVNEHGAVVDTTSYLQLPPHEDRFIYSPIKLWPPPGEEPGVVGAGAASKHSSWCAARLHDIVNAPLAPPAAPAAARPASAFAQPSSFSSLSTEIVAAADERSVVFLRRPKYGRGERSGPIVLVSFDRGIEAAALAYKVGRDTEMEMTTAAGRKDSGVEIGCGMGGYTPAMGVGKDDNKMLWERDWCWDKGCACVRERVKVNACG